MQNTNKTLRTCEKGHQFLKSSDCPVCPICEKANRPEDGFLVLLSAPARRALQYEGIDTLKKLSEHSEKEILKLHGMGKASLPILKSELAQIGLNFKN